MTNLTPFICISTSENRFLWNFRFWKKIVHSWHLNCFLFSSCSRIHIFFKNRNFIQWKKISMKFEVFKICTQLTSEWFLLLFQFFLSANMIISSIGIFIFTWFPKSIFLWPYECLNDSLGITHGPLELCFAFFLRLQTLFSKLTFSKLAFSSASSTLGGFPGISRNHSLT